MKLSARDIDGFMRAPDKQSAAVLFYGPDSGLVRERSKAVAATLLGKDADPMNRVELSPEQLKSDPALLRDELCAMSLMGGRRLVIIRSAVDKIAPVIEAAFEGLTTPTYLIVEAEELSPTATGLRSLFEKNPRFATAACYRDEGRNLEEVIRAAFAAHNMRVASDAMHYLTANLGNDRGVTSSEIEKIALYLGQEKEVTLEAAMLLTDHNASETTEDICHAVANGRTDQAHSLLTQLLHEGAQPVSIIRALVRHFQRLDIASAHVSAGQSVEQAIASLRPPVFFKYVTPMKREISNIRPRTIANVLNLLLRTEKELKSSLLTPSLLASQAVQQAARMAA